MSRTRREFTRAVRVEIVKRATINGVVVCEQCGCAAKRWEVDHTIPDGLAIDKSKPLTAADGKVLCKGSPECCHDKKSDTQDKPAIAKAKRREAAALRVSTAPAKPLQGAPFPKTEKAAARAARGPRQSLPFRPMFQETTR